MPLLLIHSSVDEYFLQDRFIGGKFTFKKSNMFADIEFLICLFACMALYMGSYNPLDCMVSGRKSVFNLIDNPLCTGNYFSLAVYKVISVFSFQEICSDIFVYSVKVC